MNGKASPSACRPSHPVKDLSMQTLRRNTTDGRDSCISTVSAVDAPIAIAAALNTHFLIKRVSTWMIIWILLLYAPTKIVIAADIRCVYWAHSQSKNATNGPSSNDPYAIARRPYVLNATSSDNGGHGRDQALNVSSDKHSDH